MAIRWHADEPEVLREAIRFTGEETGFAARLIEKDYFCSVLLEYLAANSSVLTFKGGTCLAKVHAGFFRLSEDLDFSISTPVDASRADRRQHSADLKKLVGQIPRQLPIFRIVEPLVGANASTQYNAVIGYESLLDNHVEPVNIEVGLREPTLKAAERGQARTALLNPINGQSLIAPFPVRSLSYAEAMAEKLRAALCRREVAIRDFFDVDHAERTGAFDPMEPALLKLLKRKLAMPGTGAMDVSDERLRQLQRQLDAQLRPVLREQEFAQFDLQRSTATVRRVAEALVSG